MSYKICVVSDTNSGITDEEAKKLGISIVPMPFIIDGEEYFEGISLDSKTFYEKLVSNAEIHTSQPSIGSTTQIWDEALKKYDYVLHIPMSSALSKTYETAEMLSHQEEYEGKVFVVNNRRISITIKHSVDEALEMIKLGKSAQEIKDFLEATAEDSSIYLMVDTLKYLKKGGRVTPAAALLGSLLGIKPVLQCQGGKLDTFAKCRTIKIAKKTMINQVKEDIKNRFGEDVIINFVYANNLDSIKEFIKEAKQEIPNVVDTPIDVSLSIACHTGPGILAITCCKKHTF